VYGAGRNDFDGEKSISRDIGGHWKSRLFRALRWPRAKWVPLGPKKFQSAAPII
jgi:hypothetical protein